MTLVGFDDAAKGVGFEVATDKAGIKGADEVTGFGVASGGAGMLGAADGKGDTLCIFEETRWVSWLPGAGELPWMLQAFVRLLQPTEGAGF